MGVRVSRRWKRNEERWYDVMKIRNDDRFGFWCAKCAKTRARDMLEVL